VFWVCAFLTGIWIFLGEHHAESGACIPFYFGMNGNLSWYFSLVMYIITNSVALVGVGSCSVFTVLKYYRSVKEVRLQGQVFGGKSGRKIFVLIAPLLCSVLPMLVLQIVLICSLLGIIQHTQLQGWFLVIVLPLGSLVNPYIHTVRRIAMQQSKTKKRISK